MIDLTAARAIAEAATQQPWRRGACAMRCEQTIAEVGHIEICAAAPVAAPLDLEGIPAAEQLEERDAEADARHIETFDPPTMVELLGRLQALERAVADHDDLTWYLAGVVREHVTALDEVVAAAPDETRSVLAALLMPRLALQI